MTTKVLIVEDHEAMIEGYKILLSFVEEYQFEYQFEKTGESAYQRIIESKIKFDLIILDLNIPPSLKFKINSGEDLAKLIRETSPSSKIIISTSHIERLYLYAVNFQIRPEGFLVKSDFTATEFPKIIKSILNGNKYLSSSIYDSIANVSKPGIYLDYYNREIISFLSKGVRTKNLSEYIKLSQSAIDKRKVQIKDMLGIHKGNDEDIILEARKRNLI